MKKYLSKLFVSVLMFSSVTCSSGPSNGIGTGTADVETGAADVAIDRVFTATFSAPIDVNTVTTTSLYIALGSECVVDNRVDATNECSSTTECTITPTEALDPQTSYIVCAVSTQDSGIQFENTELYGFFEGLEVPFTTVAAESEEPDPVVADTYTVGGTISGLTSTVVLQNNGTDDLSVTSDGSFLFATELANSAAYAVTVLTQPATQTCTISNGTGTISGVNVANVVITCSTNTHSISGSISGIFRSATMQNNSDDDLTLSSDGSFTFDTEVADGANYSVTVSSQPISQTCTVSNGSGTVSGADVTNVSVECVSDGDVWTARSAAEANVWTSVTYGNGLFVAVAWGGTHRVMTSPDGITWAARDAAEANQWNSVAYGNGLFVAVAYNGTHRVMTSPDGITWTARDAAEANIWMSVTYGNGLFVAVADNGVHQVMTSPDGMTWTARDATAVNNWRSVVYANDLFVAVKSGGGQQVMTSPDGMTWTARTAAEAADWWKVTYGNGLFVASADGGTDHVMTSPDGITWTARTVPEANRWRSITYGNGLFVAVSLDGTHRVMTSPDGITWAAQSAAEENQWLSVTYGNGLFVAVAQSGTNRVMTSP